jgi:hypothetical protein
MRNSIRTKILLSGSSGRDRGNFCSFCITELDFKHGWIYLCLFFTSQSRLEIWWIFPLLNRQEIQYGWRFHSHMLSSSCPALSGSNQFSTVPACCHFKRKFPSSIFCGMCSSKRKPLGIFQLAICNQSSEVLVLNLSQLAWIQFLLTGILSPPYRATHTTLVFIVLTYVLLCNGYVRCSTQLLLWGSGFLELF